MCGTKACAVDKDACARALSAVYLYPSVQDTKLGSCSIPGQRDATLNPLSDVIMLFAYSVIVLERVFKSVLGKLTLLNVQA